MISTRNRVPAHTAPKINERIQEEIEANSRYFRQNPQQVRQRLRELDHEWDIERAIEANAGAIGLAGILLSFTDRRWIVVPLFVTGFLFQHAVQGWCPPVPVLRRLGFRTTYEIEQERRLLLAVNGNSNSRRTRSKARGKQDRPMSDSR
jgi:hypothetical protein